MSVTYSAQITGSLYVYAIDGAPCAIARSTTSSGVFRRSPCSSSFAFEMSQFWQNLQPRLQPAVPKLSTGVPGKKWLSGFFSIGSIANPVERP